MGTNSSISRIALVAGATGLVGRECLRLLACDDCISEVRALVRRPLPQDSIGPRVRECRTEFDHLHNYPDWFEVDWVFCALGTTIRQVGSQEAFRRVDYEYPLAIAKAARARGASHFLLVSALGANAHSRVFYSRVKGELEDAVLGLGYPSVTIARPSVLLGDRQERRLGEGLAKRLAWLAPPRWRPVHARQVALALVRAAKAQLGGVHVLENAALRTSAF
ncbi:MAG TPA: oxidoreductase [Gammaproteobacteria bacterium]|nr:oxidoreductase [Gammaproteobacteria bacterium]